MTDLLIRLALVFAGSAALIVGLTLAFAPDVFFVTLRFIGGGIAIIAAVAFAFAALICAILARIGG
jgi:hypothetical protein